MSDSMLRAVRAQVQGYLLGTVDLVSFQKWFGPVVWRLGEAGSADAFVRGVQLRLAEYKRGDWTEPELRTRLLDLLLPGTGPTIGIADVEAEEWRPGGDRARYSLVERTTK
jgi:hypothetical protein